MRECCFFVWCQSSVLLSVASRPPLFPHSATAAAAALRARTASRRAALQAASACLAAWRARVAEGDLPAASAAASAALARPPDALSAATSHRLRELLAALPLTPPPAAGDRPTVGGVPLPPTAGELGGRAERDAAAAALGGAAAVLATAAQYLDAPLPYTVRLRGSTTELWPACARVGGSTEPPPAKERVLLYVRPSPADGVATPAPPPPSWAARLGDTARRGLAAAAGDGGGGGAGSDAAPPGADAVAALAAGCTALDRVAAALVAPALGAGAGALATCDAGAWRPLALAAVVLHDLAGGGPGSPLPPPPGARPLTPPPGAAPADDAGWTPVPRRAGVLPPPPGAPSSDVAQWEAAMFPDAVGGGRARGARARAAVAGAARAVVAAVDAAVAATAASPPGARR